MKSKNSKDLSDEVKGFNEVHNTTIKIEKVKKSNPDDWAFRTPEEQRLFEMAYDFEDKYFEDLSLKKYEKSPIGYVQHLDGDIEYLDLNPNPNIIKIRIETPKKNENIAALYDLKDKKIVFFKGKYEYDKKMTLLHEMIHFYDYELTLNGMRDFVLINLYNKVLKFISKKDLFRILWTENNPAAAIGNGHTTLFILKALELDIRLNKKLGTVLAYGRKAWYRTIPYKKYK